MWLVDTQSFPQRWHCGQWSSFDGWAFITAELLIFIAYLAISCSIVYFFKSSFLKDYRKTAALFAVFIASCGIGHFLDLLMFWWPAYRLLAVWHWITASVSLVAAWHFAVMIPVFLRWISEAIRAIELERAAFENATIGIAYVGLDSRVIRVNPELCNIWHRSREEILNADFSWEEITYKADLVKDKALLQKLIAGERKHYQMLKRYLSPRDWVAQGGKEYEWSSLTVCRVNNYDGSLRCFVVFVIGESGVSELERLIAEQESSHAPGA